MMSKKTNAKPETIADRKINSTWHGRSLEGYIAIHPKAAGARTLTQARIMAFGEKESRVGVCNCQQNTCQRYNGKTKSNC
jgi:hypothetical protein